MSSVNKVNFQLVASCDVSSAIVLTIKNIRISSSSSGYVYFKANLIEKRNNTDSSVIESICSPIQVQLSSPLSPPPSLIFQTPLKSLSLFAAIELSVWEYSARSVVLAHSSGFLGTVCVPIFTRRGMFSKFHDLFFFENDEKNELISQFRTAALTESEADSAITEWNLPNVTTTYILSQVPESIDWVTLDLSLSDGLLFPVFYSDYFKGTAAALVMTNPAPSPSPQTTTPEPPSVLSNWMVINGPIHTRDISRQSKISGTGFIPLTDIPSAISPSPVQIVDYELFKEHPAAIKAAKIHRQNGLRIPRTKPPGSARPSADEMARINDIVAQPVRAMSETERELLVKHIWNLTDRKNALLKVLLALMSTFTEESPEGIVELVENLLQAWTPIDVDGALSLLGEEMGLSLFGSIVRKHAVDRLSSIASTKEIQLYLYQLVQSLRYEDPHEGPLGKFLIDNAVRDENLATLLFWYLECESSAEDSAGISTGLARLFGTSPSPMLEGHHPLSQQLFAIVRQEFWRDLGKTDSGKRIRKRIETQCKFRQRMLTTAKLVKTALKSTPVATSTGGGLIDSSAVSAKTEILRETLHGINDENEEWSKIDLTLEQNFPQLGSDNLDIPIPLDPRLTLVRVDERKSFCIKSAKYPFVLTCEVFNQEVQKNEQRKFMFKAGDDLRQDQLVIQFVQLIDELLKRYGLDLKLSPYKVLATSVDDGFIEFVNDSQTLSSILANHGNDLMAYFRSVRPRPECPHGVDPAVLDTFARSCAGYCAITYILGIGDRHMDNLLVTSEGKLFHVDFGYILGRDPKPFPPPMKLCREMVEGMGGTQSAYYKSFVSKCTQAFLILRRHANLLVTLLYLAANSDIKDMREQDPALAIMKVQKRLMPEVNDEIAEQNMIDLINESTNALFPVVFEKLHKWAVYWRQ